MFDTHTEEQAPLRSLLLGARLALDDFTPVTHSHDLNDLIVDNVDVISGYLSNASFFEEKGIEVNVINPRDYGIDFYGDILFTSENELLNYPGRAERFKQATIKGWHYTLSHQEELVQLIHDKYSAKLSLSALKNEAKAIVELISAGDISIGTIEATRLFRVAETYTQLELAKKISLEEINDFIAQVVDPLSLIKLNEQEQSWLKEHSDLSFTGDPDWLPYEAFDEQGKYVGIVAEYLKLIEKHSGIKFNIIPTKTWQESVAKVRDGEIDIISEMVNSSLTDTMVFTKPYLSSPIIMVMNDKQAYVNDIAQIFDKKIALIKEYGYVKQKHDKKLVQKHHKLGEIKQALVNNEFQLYYQPKVNMVSGEVFGAEALIRWIHPEKGIIPPLDFLPFIDGTELEVQTGDWVINQALQQMAKWLSQGITLEISVNIASHHLMSEAFVANLEAALALYPAVDSQYLQLEILESSAFSDLQAISWIIKTCQEFLGVNIALDDFGTGYSSLTHLRSLTANTIKIDQSFVRDVLDDPDDFTIIDGVIGLANSFNRKVIAEGVETTEHGLMLL